jgi:hypothetical protein
VFPSLTLKRDEIEMNRLGIPIKSDLVLGVCSMFWIGRCGAVSLLKGWASARCSCRALALFCSGQRIAWTVLMQARSYEARV